MSTNNDVYQVLVTKDDQSVLAKDKLLDDLAVGQLGIFDTNTNKSIDGSVPVKEFYLALGVDRDGDDVKDGVKYSAGSNGGSIHVKHIKNYSFRPHTAAQPQVVEISELKAQCDTEYALKIEFVNSKKHSIQGFVPFSRTYVVKTSCCDKCRDCPSGDCNELVKLLVDAINADGKELVIAEAVNASTDMVIDDMDAFINTNKAVNSDDDLTNNVCAKVRLTSVPIKATSFTDVSVNYNKPLQTTMNVSFVEGFNCNGKITETQEVAMEEGSGYDVKHKEFETSGWTGRPGNYKRLGLTGLANEGFEYFAKENEKYDQISLSYQHKAFGGWIEFTNNLETLIAIPASNTTTRDSVLGVLDLIVSKLGLDALSDDAGSADKDPTVVEKTSDKNDTNLDGIG